MYLNSKRFQESSGQIPTIIKKNLVENEMTRHLSKLLNDWCPLHTPTSRHYCPSYAPHRRGDLLKFKASIFKEELNRRRIISIISFQRRRTKGYFISTHRHCDIHREEVVVVFRDQLFRTRTGNVHTQGIRKLITFGNGDLNPVPIMRL